MPRVPTVRQGDINRVLRGLRAAGIGVVKVVIEPGGTVTIYGGERVEALTPLERWRAEQVQGLDAARARSP